MRWFGWRCVGLLVLGSALGAAAPARSVAQAGVADVNGVRLPYEVTGTGKPLVLIHGWAVRRGFWDINVDRLARDFRVVRYDRRGFGDATGRADLTSDAADLKALLAGLGIQRAVVVGHSQGGQVALTMALRYPDLVEAVVLFGSGPPAGMELPAGPNPPPMAEVVAIGRAHGVDSMKAFIGAWASASFGDRPGALPAARGNLLDKYNGLDLLDPAPPRNLAPPARVDELGAIRVPTLVLLGEHDMPAIRIAADALALGIPGAVKVVIPGGGHVVNLSEPERFAAEVARFVRLAAARQGR